ncbi:hypothetical protein HZF08_15740 [Paenibacillus sp. CGMCC 1.16610]|uniref:AbiTii domain-containing protein n=1 Tax=Paenibacillus anseongense TaxID=2682845 RepID=A0ABW9UJK7_9BACL|nr:MULTISPECIES: hypothetical protein [Paenibacillus]MBA2939765.1 hypothetical protein [Paenibacillus sp. CGMCC 1.16610]MVQ39425.1 hypothetical protein [Paenibacillus anseongense]
MVIQSNNEALLLSNEILRNFELSELPIQNILLKCLRLARLTNDFEGVDWLRQEASGLDTDREGFLTAAAWTAIEKSGRRYFIDDPNNKDQNQKPKKVEQAFTESIAVMEATVSSGRARMKVAYDRDVSLSSSSQLTASQGNTAERSRIQHQIQTSMERIEKIKARLYQYVLDRNYELRLGEITEDIFSRNRLIVDTALKDICPEAFQKFISVYENIKLEDDQNCENVARTCRRLIKEVAESLSPPLAAPTEVSGKLMNIGEDQYINRLIQYIDSKSSSEKIKSIVGSHLILIGETLDNVNETANKRINAEVTLQEVERCIIYTYLVFNYVLSL